MVGAAVVEIASPSESKSRIVKGVAPPLPSNWCQIVSSFNHHMLALQTCEPKGCIAVYREGLYPGLLPRGLRDVEPYRHPEYC